MKSALAGAISTASAPRVRSMCAMLLGTRASQASTNTGRPDSACMVTGVMKCVAASVSDHVDRGALFGHAPHQLGDFVAGDAPGQAEDDAFAGEVEHGGSGAEGAA